jgi:hypothetical protein
MSTLVLSDDQLRLLATAGYNLPIADGQGHIVAMTSPLPFSPAELEEIKRRTASNEPGRTSAEVFARLRELAATHGESGE